MCPATEMRSGCVVELHTSVRSKNDMGGKLVFTHAADRVRRVGMRIHKIQANGRPHPKDFMCTSLYYAMPKAKVGFFGGGLT